MDAASGIVRDTAFMGIVQLYFNVVVGVDVKPDVCTKTDLCSECFTSLVKLNETHEILLYFENLAKEIRIELLQKTLDVTSTGNKAKHENEDSAAGDQFDSLDWINEKIRRSK